VEEEQTFCDCLFFLLSSDCVSNDLQKNNQKKEGGVKEGKEGKEGKGGREVEGEGGGKGREGREVWKSVFLFLHFLHLLLSH